MKEKISAVYQIKNKITGERYVGSSVNVYERWKSHKWPSTWNQRPNSKLYKDIQTYGLDNFMFAILAPVEPEYLREVEQEFIDMLKPAYNDKRANGLDVEREKETRKAYQQSEKGKARQKKYFQTEKGKACNKAYLNKLCKYNGETLTLNTLRMRFERAGIPHPTIEAKKYLLSPTN